MSKEYRYRKHIRWGQYAIPVFFILLILYFLGLGVFLTLKLHTAFTGIVLAGVTFIFLIEGSVIWYMYYRLAGTSVSLTDDMLIHKTRKGEKHYPLENVYLEFASIKYTGGWLKIKANQDTIRLTVVLEDISGLVQELKSKLDSRQLSSHYDSHKLFGFLKTSVAADQNWERAYSLFGKLLLLTLDIAIAIPTGFIFGSIPGIGLILVSVWVGISIFWVIIPYTIVEMILMRQIAKKSNESTFSFPPRDLAYEKLVFDKAFTWGSLAYILFSLFIIVLIVGAKFFLQFLGGF